MGYIAQGALSRLSTTYGRDAQLVTMRESTVTRQTPIAPTQPVSKPVYGGVARIVAAAPPLPTSWRELLAPQRPAPPTGRVITRPGPTTTPTLPSGRINKPSVIAALEPGPRSSPTKRPPLAPTPAAPRAPGGRTAASPSRTKKPPVKKPPAKKPPAKKPPAEATETLEQEVEKAATAAETEAYSGGGGGGGGGGGSSWWSDDLVGEADQEVLDAVVATQAPATSDNTTTWAIVGAAALAAAYAIWGM